ncbi:hypothetical protein JCM10213v2_002234 [Rhodosporidiobolus nylandii]
MADDDDQAWLARPRPAPEELLGQWRSYFADPLLSLATLRTAADEGRLLERGLRSLNWRYFFSLLPSPTTLPSPSASADTFHTYSLQLSSSRSHYASLRERYLRAPDGKWVQDGAFSAGGQEEKGKTEDNGLRSSAGSGKGAKMLQKADASRNNPLGLEEENPWSSWFEDLELRKEIRKDVQRTFPDVDYFRLPATQDRLTNLLFIYCKLTPQVSYRQGMHELLAPLLWAVDFDSLPPPGVGEENSLPHLVLAREWVEHDAWGLFSELMKNAGTYYDHHPSAILSPNPQSTFSPSSFALSNDAAPSRVQPIVSIASHLFSLLSTVDTPLHAAFTSLQVEPQLFAIRWFRLLFSRELPLPDTLLLWDALFARDPSLQLTEHVALAMLLRIRGALIEAAREGYGDFLQVLLRYPPCPDGRFRAALLVQQAVFLRDNLTPAGAAKVREQNVRLGAAVGPQQPADENVDLRSPAARGMAHRRAATNPQGLGLFGARGLGDLAKGVYGRAEALGIPKAVTGVFEDIKRDFAEAQAQLEEQRRQRGAFSQIPAVSPWGPPPPAPAPAAKDALSDLAKMRASSLAMSSAIDLCCSVLERGLMPPTPVASPKLERDVGGGSSEGIPLSPPSSSRKSGGAAGGTGQTVPPQIGQVMALTALKHIRDVLGGQAQVFDESVLAPLNQLLETSGLPSMSPSLNPSFPPPGFSTRQPSSASSRSPAPSGARLAPNKSPVPRDPLGAL